MIELISSQFDNEDDPELWRAALDHILAELSVEPGTLVEIGRCSHWLRPHQTRWKADGGFAWPVGYGGHGYSRNGLPLFDWSIILKWTGDHWDKAEAPAKGRKLRTSPRIAIPSRTRRHKQAAIHTLWISGKHQERRLYGFRNRDGLWQCTAETDWGDVRHNTKDPSKKSSAINAVCRTEEDWLTGTDPRAMLTFVANQKSVRPTRLFAVACCRRIWASMPDQRSRNAVEVSERFADGLASEEELSKAFGEARDVPEESLLDEPLDDYLAHNPDISSKSVADACAAEAASAVTYSDHLAMFLKNAAWDVADAVYALNGFNAEERNQERMELCDLVREIFGNPFRPISISAAWLTLDVISLAQTIYDQRAFGRMPELAELLEAAGCDDSDIIPHCRGSGPHVRGCWVIDLILGKR